MLGVILFLVLAPLAFTLVLAGAVFCGLVVGEALMTGALP